MSKAGKLDKTASDALAPVTGKPVFLTADQTQKAKDYLAANWAKAIG
jgi:putative spermidine/putrescine transport system substrate-binding protein